jgi:hypothetical protein
MVTINFIFSTKITIKQTLNYILLWDFFLKKERAGKGNRSGSAGLVSSLCTVFTPCPLLLALAFTRHVNKPAAKDSISPSSICASEMGPGHGHRIPAIKLHYAQPRNSSFWVSRHVPSINDITDSIDTRSL